MRKIKSFQVKLTLAFAVCMFFTAALSDFIIYRYTLKNQFNQLRDKLKIIAQTASLLIDPAMLSQVPLDNEGMYSPGYKTIQDKLKKVKEVNPEIRFVYTMAKTAKEGFLQFIVDADPVVRKEKQKLTAFPGEKYDASRFPQMLRAFDGASADKKLLVDAWGATLSGYAPILDSTGKAIAILGVDMLASEVYETQREVRRRAVFVLVLGIILSVVLGVLFSKRIASPIKKLVEGTRHIAKGDLKYFIEIAGNDEISDLTRSFNEMTANLYESRRKLHNYFYGVIQSFVRLVEARDPYTRGHSERVALYAEKIAAKLGLPQDKAQLVRETALLHDIGKFGVKESILNKKESLTEEEWETIRKHPVIGEEILKPILLNEEMQGIVREHHERFDGKGYPDRLKGDKINLLAQILSVADSYDAMTSSRAYRPAFTKEKAIEELKKASGSQFNPKVVDAFIEVLREEE
jgi:putative nucleotidyltransferase with HDIG domain